MPYKAIFWGYIPLHRPYKGLTYGRYLQFRFLKWPLIWWWIFFDASPKLRPVFDCLKRAGARYGGSGGGVQALWEWSASRVRVDLHAKGSAAVSGSSTSLQQMVMYWARATWNPANNPMGKWLTYGNMTSKWWWLRIVIINDSIPLII